MSITIADWCHTAGRGNKLLQKTTSTLFLHRFLGGIISVQLILVRAKASSHFLLNLQHHPLSLTLTCQHNHDRRSLMADNFAQSNFPPALCPTHQVNIESVRVRQKQKVTSLFVAKT
jgi:hypothetical protein